MMFGVDFFILLDINVLRQTSWSSPFPKKNMIEDVAGLDVSRQSIECDTRARMSYQASCPSSRLHMCDHAL